MKNIYGKEVGTATIHSYAGMHSCFSFKRYTEVIGNIYESPELIEKDGH
jgi:hypothetical protein